MLDETKRSDALKTLRKMGVTIKKKTLKTSSTGRQHKVFVLSKGKKGDEVKHEKKEGTK